MDLAQRIKAARDHANLTQGELAEKLKGLMTQQNISLLERGITKGTEYIVQIAIACNVNAEWLATGEGQMQKSEYGLSHQLAEHLKVMEQLPDYARTEVIQTAIKTVELISKAQAATKSNGATQ